MTAEGTSSTSWRGGPSVRRMRRRLAGSGASRGGAALCARSRGSHSRRVVDDFEQKAIGDATQPVERLTDLLDQSFSHIWDVR